MTVLQGPIQPFDPIYKRTQTGATQIWYQEVDGKGSRRTVSGQLKGKRTTSKWKLCKTTNPGKKNERLPAAQALFECAAAHKKKLEKDYHESIGDINEGSKIFVCMTAATLQDRLAKKVSKTYPEVGFADTFSQPKLNGMRCLSRGIGLRTRNGKVINSVPHIEEALALNHKMYPGIIFDGELYNHAFHDNFNELMSIFKRDKNTPEDFEKARKHGQLHLYDVTVEEGVELKIAGLTLNKDTSFLMRIIILEKLLRAVPSPTITLTETIVVNSEAHQQELFAGYQDSGYEGQMVRFNVPYENRRSWGLLKNKDFEDAEYTLVDILEGQGNWKGFAKRAVLLHNGADINNHDSVKDTFSAGITGTQPFCKDLLENKHKYIGKKTTVNYQNLSPDKNVPIFGRCKEFDRMDID